MKKMAVICLSALMVFSLSACGNSQNGAEDTSAESQITDVDTEPQDNSVDNAEQDTESTEQNTEGAQGNSTEENTDAGAGDMAGAGSGNILVAYFSVMETDGVDTVAGASRVAVDGEVLGNNQYIAQIIQQQTGGDLFSNERYRNIQPHTSRFWSLHMGKRQTMPGRSLRHRLRTLTAMM